MTVLRDRFNRTDDPGSLGVADQGGTWIQADLSGGPAVFGILDGKAYTSTVPGVDDFVQATLDAETPNHRARALIDLSGPGPERSGGVVVGWDQATLSGLLWGMGDLGGGDAYVLFTLDGGAFSGAAIVFVPTVLDPAVLEASIRNGRVSCYANGTLIAEVAVPAGIVGTRCGIGGGSSSFGTTWDDFEGGTSDPTPVDCGPTFETCRPWATVEDVERLVGDADCFADNLTLLEDALEIASETLFVLSGRQFPGICEVTVRPCAVEQPTSSSPTPLVGYQTDSFAAFGGACSCHHPPGRSCGCCGPSETRLGYSPIVEVSEVLIDGATLDPAAYRIDDGKYLVRLPNPGSTVPQSWPCCQRLDLPTTEAETWSVTFCYGKGAPPLGVAAAARFAAEIAKGALGLDCCIAARNVTSMSREGVSIEVLSPTDFLTAGLLNIFEADLFIQTYNPAKIRKNAKILSPDTGPRGRVTTWP